MPLRVPPVPAHRAHWQQLVPCDPAPDDNNGPQVQPNNDEADDEADAVAALNKLTFRRRKGIVNAVAAHPEDDQDTLIAELETWRQADHRRHKVLWRACVIYMSKNIVTEESTWYLETVLKYSPLYTPFVLAHTNPSPGRDSLKATTIDGWSKTYIENITTYTWDPDANGRAGMVVLTTGGLYQKLKEVVFNLVLEKNLDCNMSPKVYYGRSEVLLVIQEILSHAIQDGTCQCSPHDL
ncbi:hypothetical protein B0H15DRAFT_958398 [Mycena belliarum]|uniref:Uncharacterized protein n=1 Tax=Mycena belliarum TaxID=1033014 RepID=A0AAD6TP88_9AGAR|nr:hypothetical protein B0H15DRAFT_958398 [Mycena belliae]